MENPKTSDGRTFAEGRDSGPDFELAPRWRRFVAIFCDFLTVVIPVPVSFFLLFSGLSEANTPGGLVSPVLVLMIFIPPILVILALLGINLYFLTRDGQTVGKKILSIRIANRDGGRAKLTSIIFLRIVPFWVLFIIVSPGVRPGLTELIGYSHNPVLQVISRNPSLQIISAGLLVMLVDILFILRRDRRALHDMLAGTIVIMK
jgi:uncharacterized RDD family membrane protein YckC